MFAFSLQLFHLERNRTVYMFPVLKLFSIQLRASVYQDSILTSGKKTVFMFVQFIIKTLRRGFI